MSSRRKFLQMTAMSVTATGLSSFVSKASPVYEPVEPAETSYQLAMAGYTFRYFDVDQSIAMMKRTGVKLLSIKEFHLPLDSSPEKIKEVKDKFNAAGITIYAAGVIYFKTKEEVDRAFNYAKNLGVDLIVGVPTVELLPYSEAKVKEHNIRLAIHNHGPEDKLYPSPADVYSKISKMDPRVGLCLDIGHSLRAGTDPAKAVSDYAPRIFDLHIKDLLSNAKDAKGVELGRGVMDIPSVIKALKKIGFKGKCSLEYELDMKDPLPGIAESVGYFHGVSKLLG
ncbi:MAG TPA: sugar phosphate isomerase/epimerase family protein [Flavitalea sp.]|nr:sugar phosphate isomerase/epimerase family protein [Flavitalea sp.]